MRSLVVGAAAHGNRAHTEESSEPDFTRLRTLVHGLGDASRTRGEGDGCDAEEKTPHPSIRKRFSEIDVSKNSQGSLLCFLLVE